MTNSPSIVLLGGSGLGPWAWERVTPILRASGFRTLAPQISATGDDMTPPAHVSLTDWINDVTEFIGGEQALRSSHTPSPDTSPLVSSSVSSAGSRR